MVNATWQQWAQSYLVHEHYSRYGESIVEDFYEFYPEELEEFVTAIVRHCAEFARQHNLAQADRSHMVHRAMLEHFGVES